jgi:hypothetical protein
VLFNTPVTVVSLASLRGHLENEVGWTDSAESWRLLAFHGFRG